MKAIIFFLLIEMILFLAGAGIIAFFHWEELNAAFLILLFGSLFISIIVTDIINKKGTD